MAKQTRVVETLIDDLDGSTYGVQTIKFWTPTGNHLKGDFSASNRDEIERLLDNFALDLAPYIAVMRSSKHAEKTRPQRRESAKIREWAGENGYPVHAKGQLSQAVRAAYHDAHSS